MFTSWRSLRERVLCRIHASGGCTVVDVLVFVGRVVPVRVVLALHFVDRDQQRPRGDTVGSEFVYDAAFSHLFGRLGGVGGHRRGHRAFSPPMNVVGGGICERVFDDLIHVDVEVVRIETEVLGCRGERGTRPVVGWNPVVGGERRREIAFGPTGDSAFRHRI